MQQVEQHMKTIIASKHGVDGLIGVGGVSAWAWWPYVEGGFAVLMGIGGLVLLILRILIAWREYKDGGKES